MMRKENKLQAFNIEAFSLLALPRVTRWIASCQTHTPSLSLPRAKSLAASSALNHPAPAFILWDWPGLTAALIVASLLPPLSPLAGWSVSPVWQCVAACVVWPALPSALPGPGVVIL